MPNLNWLRWWWPALAWAAMIALFSTDAFSSSHTSRIIVPLLHWLFPALPGRTLTLLHHYVRKAAHVGEYFLLSLFLVRAMRRGRSGWRPGWAGAAVAIAAGWAAIDEAHQILVPSRGPSVRDVLIDLSGAILAQGVYFLFLRLRWGHPRGVVPSS